MRLEEHTIEQQGGGLVQQELSDEEEQVGGGQGRGQLRGAVRVPELTEVCVAGSTAVLALLLVANVGNSRALLCRRRHNASTSNAPQPPPMRALHQAPLLRPAVPPASFSSSSRGCAFTTPLPPQAWLCCPP